MTSIYIKRVLKAVEDLRAFDRRDAARLADELQALPHDTHAEHLAKRLKDHVKREEVLVALRGVL